MNWNQTRAAAIEDFGTEYSEGEEIKLTLPRKFYEDHVERELPHGYVIAAHKYTVVVMMTRAEITELLSDADYYADAGIAAEMGMRDIAQSAKRTIDAIGRHIAIERHRDNNLHMSFWRLAPVEVAA